MKGKKGFQKGHKSFWTEEAKQKVLGKHTSTETEFKKGHPSQFKGKKRPNIAGKNAYQWKGGLPKCLDCSKQLSSYVAKRCASCLPRFRVGKNHPRFKHGMSYTKEYRAHYGRIKQDKRRGALGSHSAAEWHALKLRYGFMCLCCKKREPEIRLTRDHITPLSKGGSNNISNIQPLCNSCNSQKYTQTVDYTNVPLSDLAHSPN